MNTKKPNKREVKYPVSRNLKILHNGSIFRPIKRGRRRVGVKHNFDSANTKIAVEMAEELDVADQDLMIALFAIARSKEFGTLALYDKAWTDSDGKETSVKDSLSVELGVFDWGGIPSSELRSIQIGISKFELLKELDRPTGGSHYEWLIKSLKRLSSTVYHYDGEKWRGSFSMLSYLDDKESDQLLITINPIASYAIRRDDKGYVLQHRGERGKLKSEEARALHSVLCSMVDPDKQETFKLSSLVDKVWGDGKDDWSRATHTLIAERYGKDRTMAEIDEMIKADLAAETPTIRKNGSEFEVLNKPVSPKTIRNKKSLIKKVLETEVNSLENWAIKVSGTGSKAVVTVRRKKAKKSLLELSS